MSRVAAWAGLVFVLAVTVWLFAGRRESSLVATQPSAHVSAPGGSVESHEAVDTRREETSNPESSIPVLGQAPSLEGLDGWLQSEVSSLEELRGNVVVVQFWTFGCRNCKATIPHLRDLLAAHADDRFEIVGVHAPEFSYEQEPEAIEAAAARLGVTWPIALDTERSNFRRWQGSQAYWPRTYVIDAEGRIRFDHIGEGAYSELASVVEELLAG